MVKMPEPKKEESKDDEDLKALSKMIMNHGKKLAEGDFSDSDSSSSEDSKDSPNPLQSKLNPAPK